MKEKQPKLMRVKNDKLLRELEGLICTVCPGGTIGGGNIDKLRDLCDKCDTRDFDQLYCGLTYLKTALRYFKTSDVKKLIKEMKDEKGI